MNTLLRFGRIAHDAGADGLTAHPRPDAHAGTKGRRAPFGGGDSMITLQGRSRSTVSSARPKPPADCAIGSTIAPARISFASGVFRDPPKIFLHSYRKISTGSSCAAARAGNSPSQVQSHSGSAVRFRS